MGRDARAGGSRAHGAGDGTGSTQLHRAQGQESAVTISRRGSKWLGFYEFLRGDG